MLEKHLNKFTWVFAALSASYLIAQSFDGYLLQPAHKALPILLLAGLVIMTKGINRVLVTAALLFSATGDVLLALPLEKSFEFGLTAFACAQLTYFIYFISKTHWQKWKQLPLIGIVVLFVAVSFVVLPASGDLVWHVLFYSGTLMLMTCSALLSVKGIKTQFYGALTFVVSDSLIAINKFVVTLPYEGLMIMFTYYLAQFLIIKGIIDTEQQNETA